MKYIDADYQRNERKSSDNEKVYDCTGKPARPNKSKPKRCKGRISFPADNIEGEIIENKERLIGGRLHSHWCEYSEANRDMKNTARFDGLEIDSNGELKSRKDVGPEQPVRSDDESSSLHSSMVGEPESLPRSEEETTSTTRDQLCEEGPSSEWQVCRMCNVIGDLPTVKCDNCKLWFHNRCEGFPEKRSGLPYCSRCRPVSVKKNALVDAGVDSQDNQLKAPNLSSMADGKLDQDAQTVQCDCCQDWFHSRCESLPEERSEPPYCPTCLECFKELDESSDDENEIADASVDCSQDNQLKAPINLSTLTDEKSDEDAQEDSHLCKTVYEGEQENETGKKITDQITTSDWETALNELECFVDHLEEVPYEQGRVKAILQKCNDKIGKILNKSGAGDDRQRDEERIERWQKMDQSLEKLFESTQAKWKKMNDAFEAFCGSLAAITGQTAKDSKPEVPSLVCPPQLIRSLSDLSDLTYGGDYERMNASQAPACSTSEATIGESTSDQLQVANGDLADHLEGSKQSKMELLPNEGSRTFGPKPTGRSSWSSERPAKRMRTEFRK